MFLVVLTLAVSRSAFAADTTQSDEALRERVMAILREVPLIDGHNDVPWQYRNRFNNHLDQADFAGDLSTLEPPMHTDIPRLREGGMGAQFWSVYIPISMRGGQPGDARIVLEQIDFVHRLAEKYSDDLEIALTADDIERIHGEGRIASLMGMEGGHSIENSLAVLRGTYNLGVRYMTLTHWRSLEWADAATDAPINNGLSKFGEEVVREMNRLGMMVDIAHVSPDTMRDALAVSEAPVIFSHSSAYEVCNHARNAPDDVLLQLKDNNGIIMICFLGSYVSEDLRLWQEEMERVRAQLVQQHREDHQAIQRDLAAWQEENPQPQATLAQVADHIDHVRDLIGVEYIGIGGDYDGTTSLPVGLEDVSKYPDLFVELLKRGYSDEDIKKIAGLNLLRVMRDVEEAAAKLRESRPPSSALIEEVDGAQRRSRGVR